MWNAVPLSAATSVPPARPKSTDICRQTPRMNRKNRAVMPSVAKPSPGPEAIIGAVILIMLIPIRTTVVPMTRGGKNRTRRP